MEYIEKTVEAKVENLHEILEFVEEQLEIHEANMKVITTTSISVEEMYANVCMYAYESFAEPGECTVRIGFEDNNVYISLIDSGMEFDPLKKEDPDIHADIEERGIGGLGIYMVKEYMDECTYERKDGFNIFTMRKAIK